MIGAASRISAFVSLCYRAACSIASAGKCLVVSAQMSKERMFMSRQEIAKDVTISMVSKGEISLKNVQNIHDMYSRRAQENPNDIEAVERLEGLKEALDILNSK